MLTELLGPDWFTLRRSARGAAAPRSITTIAELIRAEPFQETQQRKSFQWLLRDRPSTPLRQQHCVTVCVCVCVCVSTALMHSLRDSGGSMQRPCYSPLSGLISRAANIRPVS